MSWADLITRGGGKTEYRLKIEGWPDEWVTASDLAGAVGDGRTRRVGLKRASLQFNEKCDPARVELSGDGPNFLIADIDGLATASFARRSNPVASIRELVDDSETSIDVNDVTGLTLNSYYHIGQEVWKATAIASSPITVTRAQWDSRAQYHYEGDEFSKLANPIYDYPLSMRGRRVWLYGYGDGETGTGTLIWQGIVAVPPRRRSLAEWEIACDPRSKLLEQEMASDMESIAKPRGFHFPWIQPLIINFSEQTGANWGDSQSAHTAAIKITGFFETIEELCNDSTNGINQALDADSGYGSFTSVVRAVNLDGALAFRIQVATSPNHHFVFGSVVWNRASFLDQGELEDRQGNFTKTVVSNGTYYLRPSADIATEPVGWFGGRANATEADVDTSQAATWPSNTLYLTKNISAQAGEFVQIANAITWGLNRQQAFVGRIYDEEIVSVDLNERSVVLKNVWGQISNYGSFAFGRSWTGDTEIYQKRQYGTSTDVDGFRDELITQGVKSNAGWTPNVSGDDLADWTTVISAVSAQHPFFSQRDYTFREPQDLIEVLQHELRLLGLYLVTDTDEKIAVERIGLPVESAASAQTITHADILTSKAIPMWELETEGIINAVEYKTGYNRATEQFEGAKYLFRDGVSIASAGGQKFVLEVAPPFEADAPIDIELVRSNVERILRFLSRPYYTIRVPIAATKFDVRLGTTILLTSRDIPDVDGTLGLTGKAALVIARAWDLDSLQGEITLMTTNERAIGYAPSAQVNPTYTSNVGGAVWDIGTVQTTFAPTGKTDISYFAVGDRIRIRRRNVNATVSGTSATIDSITGTTPGYVMQVTFDSTVSWTPNTYDYVEFSWNTTDTISTNMQSFAYVADSSAQLKQPSGDPAHEFTA